jgi:hypothetical protein
MVAFELRCDAAYLELAKCEVIRPKHFVKDASVPGVLLSAVFEKGKAIGKASLTQVTVGAQLGGQTQTWNEFVSACEAC